MWIAFKGEGSMTNSTNRPTIDTERPLTAHAQGASAAPSATTILVADDSQLFRERLARAFRDRGFHVLAACDYDEAMRLASETPPDLAVVDLRMPGRSGLELVRDLIELDARIRVLVLSGFGSIATAVDAIKLGAVNFLPKPADANEILAAFERSDVHLPEETAVVESAEAPSLARVEWEHIHRVLADCDGNISEAARRLGIHRRSLQRKLRKRAPE
jgi:two-component system response regulator RegA